MPFFFNKTELSLERDQISLHCLQKLYMFFFSMFLKKANIDDIIDMGQNFQTYCQNHQQQKRGHWLQKGRQLGLLGWFNDRAKF